MPVTVMCQQCSDPIVVSPSRASRRKFCSHECRHLWMSENQRGDAHPMKGRRHTPESIRKMSEGQRANNRTGERSAVWKGGRHLARGYVMVSLATLPAHEQETFAEMATRSSGKFIPEHRLVMARELGRPLTRGEVVHHINGVKTDNRPENLEMHGARTHKMTHAELYRELRELRALASKCSCGTFPPTG